MYIWLAVRTGGRKIDAVLGWVFHTVRGGVDAGDTCFRSWVIGVVDA